MVETHTAGNISFQLDAILAPIKATFHGWHTCTDQRDTFLIIRVIEGGASMTKNDKREAQRKLWLLQHVKRTGKAAKTCCYNPACPTLADIRLG
jgi:hypothetical protein